MTKIHNMTHILADGTFKCIILKENICIWNKNSLNFAPNVSIDEKFELVQVLAWYWTGDKPLT